MSVVISGKLIGPNGDPRAGVTITLRAVKTSSAVVQYAPSTTETGSDGRYSLTAQTGKHEVIIEAYGQPPEKVGTITVFNDSLPGTLNDYLTTPGESEITPVIIQTVEEMRAAANESSVAAIAAAERAESAATSAMAAGRFYADTSTGLAATSAGDIFATPSSDVPTDGITYWLNDAGSATAVSKTVGEASISNLATLNKLAAYSSPDYGGEYELAQRLVLAVVDDQGNILQKFDGDLFTFKKPLTAPALIGDRLVLGGVDFTSDSIPPEYFVQNLIRYADAAKFLSSDEFGAAGEYELFGNVQSILLDDDNNIIEMTRDGVKTYLLPIVLKNATIEKLTAGGKDIDLTSLPDSATSENITVLSSQSKYIASTGEYELNKKPFVLVDSNKNMLFDVEEWLKKKSLWDEAYKASQTIPTVETNPLAPFTVTDSAGKSQIRVYNTDNNTETTITSGDSNETNPHIDGTERIVWTSDRADNAPGGLFYANKTNLIPYPYIARLKLVGWGHSMMENARMMNRLQELTGLYAYNFGRSSARSVAVAARQGGDPAYYVPTAGTIPADVQNVPLTAKTGQWAQGPCFLYNPAEANSIACTYAGIPGTFIWDGSAPYFARSAAGDAVTVTDMTPINVIPTTTQPIPNGAPAGTVYYGHDECINIFWLGRNNIAYTDEIIGNAVNMVKYLKSIGKRVVILPDFPGATDTTGSTGAGQVALLNNTFKKQFPEFYCQIDGVDMLQNFINHHNPDYADDVTDVTNGVTPRSLRYDYLHPSQAKSSSMAPDYALYVGAEVNAEFVYNFMQLKGWV
ncbi:N-terminal phage tail fiber protein [Sodalis praecaptivus]|uniref:N-terminal phage tail fiber protein n=1 Tax=Sodalis praecaptivus TaxID=1239307 RepID=W0I0A8_9GAMM|nr:prophage tail fiber N-terminal domain-containing protein [Sodalis praecaptivus]AHF77883.1 N-terminal phage tail fiber protein [Sodalis praecaptivus]